MNKTIQELIPLIHKWAEEREIYEELTPFEELLKTHEEVGELIKACYDNDKSAVQDAIGDVLITLINYWYLRGENIETIIEKVLSEPFEAHTSHILSAIYANKSIIDLFLDEAINKYSTVKPSPFLNSFNVLKHLNNIALLANTTLEECLNIAYNEIKNRKGKIFNGKFIKDEE